jgi:hypothetical protein
MNLLDANTTGFRNTAVGSEFSYANTQLVTNVAVGKCCSYS